MELSLSEYSVRDVVETVRASLRSLASEKGLDFVTEVADDLPEAYGDSKRITQCLLNLTGNALKFTRRGQVVIGVERQGDGAALPGDRHRHRHRAPSTSTPSSRSSGRWTPPPRREFVGTGLGLSITKKFVELHGGRIWVESELGPGLDLLLHDPAPRGERDAGYERQDDPERRGQRVQPQDRAPAAGQDLVSPPRGGGRRGGHGLGPRVAARPDPDGHPAAEDLGPRGDPPAARRSAHGGGAHHRDHLVRAERRRAEGHGRGATAYLAKPYSPRELLAKIREIVPEA